LKLDRHVKKVLRGKLGNQHKRVTIEYIDCRPSSHEPARDESGFRTMKIKMIRCHAACLASNLMQDNQVRRSDRLKEAAAKAQDNLIAPFKATALPRRNPGFPPKKTQLARLKSMPLTRSGAQIGIGGAVTRPPLPHHRTCGSAYGGSVSTAKRGPEFQTPFAIGSMPLYRDPFRLHRLLPL